MYYQGHGKQEGFFHQDKILNNALETLPCRRFLKPGIEEAVAPTSVASMWPWKSMANKIATTPPPTLDKIRSTRIGAATADPHVRT